MASADDEAFWELTHIAFAPSDALHLFDANTLPPTSGEVSDFADRMQRDAIYGWSADLDEDDDGHGDDGGGSRVPAWPPKTPPQRPGGMALDVPCSEDNPFAEGPSGTQLRI